MFGRDEPVESPWMYDAWHKAEASNSFSNCVEVARAWRKASASLSLGNCVETAQVPRGVAVRDSKDPSGPVLLCSAA